MSSLERLRAESHGVSRATQRHHSRRCRHRFAVKETGMRIALEQHRNRFAESHDTPEKSSVLSTFPFLDEPVGLT